MEREMTTSKKVGNLEMTAKETADGISIEITGNNGAPVSRDHVDAYVAQSDDGKSFVVNVKPRPTPSGGLLPANAHGGKVMISSHEAYRG
jgi:hypothetical protein